MQVFRDALPFPTTHTESETPGLGPSRPYLARPLAGAEDCGPKHLGGPLPAAAVRLVSSLLPTKASHLHPGIFQKALEVDFVSFPLEACRAGGSLVNTGHLRCTPWAWDPPGLQDASPTLPTRSL